MRIRTIKPEFWSHPVLGRLPPFPKLLAIGLLNMADDEGFFVADVSIIKSSLFPFTDDSVSIHGALTDLSLHGFIATKKHPERGMLGLVVNFGKHQVINRATPSRIRGYWDSVITHGGLTDGSLPEQGTGNKGTGSMDQGNEEALPPQSPAARPKRFTKPTLAEVEDYCKSRGNGVDAEQFMNRYESNGWLIGKSPMKDWRAAVRTWERNKFTQAGQKPQAKASPEFTPDPPSSPDIAWALQQIANAVNT
jgi:hypothetical protein